MKERKNAQKAGMEKNPKPQTRDTVALATSPSLRVWFGSAMSKDEFLRPMGAVEVLRMRMNKRTSWKSRQTTCQVAGSASLYVNTASLPDVNRYHAATPSKFGLAVKARARHACELDLKVSELMEGLNELGPCPSSAH